MCKLTLCLFLLFVTQLTLINCIEPITMGVGATVALMSGGYAAYETYVKCKLSECCDDNWIYFNRSGLEHDLYEKVFGQHFVKQLIPRILWGHVNNPNPKSALVMSFNGPPGCGKNYVKQIIAKHLYVKGTLSNYVYFFDGARQFSHKNDAEINKNILKDSIRKQVEQATKKCGRSLFVFDEVDKMPSGLLDVLKPYIDNYYSLDGVNYKKNIFIFLSNTGERDITALALKFWSDGKNRDEITLKDIEHSIATSSFNEKGGLQQSDIVKHNLIDIYVPFLPLERKHVRQCVKAEFERRGFKPSNFDLIKIADLLQYAPPETKLYSVSGCRQIDFKIDLHYDYLPPTREVSQGNKVPEFEFIKEGYDYVYDWYKKLTGKTKNYCYREGKIIKCS